jgi:beta-barrel assembly-enhancing protease
VRAPDAVTMSRTETRLRPHPPAQFARRTIAALLAALLGAAPVSGARTPSGPLNLPALGDVTSEDLSPANERRLGEAVMRQVRADPSWLPDPDTTEYLNALGFRLVAASPARHSDFSFFAMRDPMLNAFALPGGFIGVHSGLVLGAQTEAELASVLAHEIGHVEQRHIARMISRERDSGLITIGSLLLALLAARSNSASSADATQAALAVGQAAAMQQQLNFSREAEREADRVGHQILVSAGFEPAAMANFFGRLQQGSRVYESAAPVYLRTHPLTVERMADIQTRVRESRSRPRAESLDFHLIRARLRVLQDESAQGLRDASEFFADQLRSRSTPFAAAAHYGRSLVALQAGQQAQALESVLTAKKLVTTPSPYLDKLHVQVLHAGSAAERNDALRLAREATVRYPVSRLTALNYAELLQKAGADEQAVSYLREQLALARSDRRYHELLARSYERLNRRTLAHQSTAELYLQLGALPAAIEQLHLARRANDADFYTLSEIEARLRELNRALREQRGEAAPGRSPEEEPRRSPPSSAQR